MIGGAVTFVNPEPLALFADVIAAGEGEALIPSLARGVQVGDRTATICCAGWRRSAASTCRRSTTCSYRERRDDRRASCRSEGTGAPAVVQKAALKTTEAVDPPATTIFTPDTEFGSRFLVEVVRGCANLCRFCWAGYNYLPVRAFPEGAHPAAGRGRARRTRIASGSCRSRCAITRTSRRSCTRLVGDGLQHQPGVAAARRSHADDPAAAARERRAHASRSRRKPDRTGCAASINKTVTNDEILAAAELIFAAGIENLKLYFMIGIPTETDDDLVAIRDLTLQLRDIMLRHAAAAGTSAASSAA